MKDGRVDDVRAVTSASSAIRQCKKYLMARKFGLVVELWSRRREPYI